MFTTLKESDSVYKPQLVQFYEYFENYYVGVNPKKTVGRKPRNPKPVERLSPMFSVEH